MSQEAGELTRASWLGRKAEVAQNRARHVPRLDRGDHGHAAATARAVSSMMLPFKSSPARWEQHRLLIVSCAFYTNSPTRTAAAADPDTLVSRLVSSQRITVERLTPGNAAACSAVWISSPIRGTIGPFAIWWLCRVMPDAVAGERQPLGRLDPLPIQDARDLRVGKLPRESPD